MITNKTQTQKDIDQIEKLADNTIRALKAAVSSLNNSFDYFWSLPNDRLESVINELLVKVVFEDIFEKHFKTATAFNNILASNGVMDIRCKSEIPKVMTFDVEGVKISEKTHESEAIMEPVIVEESILEE
jgi:hypothetical protein